MAIEMREFGQDKAEFESERGVVRAIATQLRFHLETPAVQAQFEFLNLPGASSQVIQSVFRDFALGLGFADESEGLFQSYETSALRPDYFVRLDDTGILLEVERGKTTINNMDLLDFWKCHLCEHAHYLFLLVPRALRQNPTMSPRNEFASVVKRLGAFFRPRNYTNVRGLFVYGY